MLWHVDPSRGGTLQAQIAGCVRRGLASGELSAGERLPPARDLAAALDVNPNTVLAAYRTLRADGVLEFRRGRGVRVSPGADAHGPVAQAVRDLVDLADRHGLGRKELVRLIEELP